MAKYSSVWLDLRRRIFVENKNGKMYFVLAVAVFCTGIYFIFQTPSSFNGKKYLSSKDSLNSTTDDGQISKKVFEETAKAVKITPKPISFRTPASKPGSPLFRKKLRRRIKEQRVKREEATMDEEIFNGTTFESREVSFEKVDNFFAILPEDYLPNNYEKVQELNGLYIVSYNGSKPVDALDVVKNNETGNLAIFTGILRVKLKDYDQAKGLIELINEDISAQNKKVEASVSLEFEHINIASYKFDNYESTIFVYKLLQTEPFEGLVERVTVDLIEWKRTSN